MKLSVRFCALICPTNEIAENPPLIVETAVAERPDLILMNSLMPDGWLGSQRVLRADPQTKDIPILAMTALQLKSSVDTASRMQRLHSQAVSDRRTARKDQRCDLL